MMTDDLTTQLDALASDVDTAMDLAALHRRISRDRRGRTGLRFGAAAVGAVALVGALVVVSANRPGTVDNPPAAAGTTSPPEGGLVECAAMLAAQQAVPKVPSGAERQRGSGDGAIAYLPEADFKGEATILGVDGAHLTFQVEASDLTSADLREGIVDDSTVWLAGEARLDAALTLHAGDRIGVATALGADGAEHVVFIDTQPSAAPAKELPADAKAAVAGESGDTTVADSQGGTVDAPGPVLPPGPTRKAIATVTGVGGTSISMSIDEGADAATIATAALPTTPFYAGDVRCAPSTLAVGSSVALAYHFDSAGQIVTDAVMVLP